MKPCLTTSVYQVPMRRHIYILHKLRPKFFWGLNIRFGIEPFYSYMYHYLLKNYRQNVRAPIYSVELRAQINVPWMFWPELAGRQNTSVLIFVLSYRPWLLHCYTRRFAESCDRLNQFWLDLGPNFTGKCVFVDRRPNCTFMRVWELSPTGASRETGQRGNRDEAGYFPISCTCLEF